MGLRHLLLIAIGFGWAASGGAQTPASIIVLKFRGYAQVSTSEVELRGGLLLAQVEFPSTVSAGTTVQLRGPTSTIALNRQPNGSYEAAEEYADLDELNRRIPDGTYTLTVSGSGTSSATVITIASSADTPVTRISNFDELQGYPSDMPLVRWQHISGATSTSLLGLTVLRADGTELYSVASTQLANSDRVQISRSLPMGEELEALLTYARVTVAQANNQSTNVATGSGFALTFPIRAVARAPIFQEQASSQVLSIGGTANLFVSHNSDLQGLTYRLIKDGAPVPGVNPSLASGAWRTVTYTVPIRQPADAGAYTIELTNQFGTATTLPMRIAVMARLDTTIFVGGDTPGAVDGPAAAARLDVPRGLVSDAAGNLYSADWRRHTIRKISPSGDVSTLAGVAGSEGASDGSGANVRFRFPAGLAFDTSGNLYVADSGNHTIRRITPSGIVTTLAGAAGQRGSNDGAASLARFDSPQDVAVDGMGNVFVADTSNRTIRRISSAGVVTTLAGRAGLPSGESVDGVGANARFRAPRSLAVDSGGRVYVGDDHVALRRLDADGGVTTIYGQFTTAKPVAVDTGRGDGLGGGPTLLHDVALDPSGVLHVLTPSGVLRIVEGGAAVNLGLSYKHPTFGHDVSVFNATALGFGRDGTFYISDEGRIYRASLVPGHPDPLVSIVNAPRAHSVPAGGSVALSVEAAGPGLSYQWFKDGVGLGGATTTTLFLSEVGAGDGGRYSVLVGNGAGAVASAPVTLGIGAPAQAARLVNLSIRSSSGAGPQALTVGLVLAGADGGTRNLLVRGVGPTLAEFGVSNAMRDPMLTLMRSGATLGTNDDWGGTLALADAFANAGAFPLALGARDAALTLPLAAGDYTVQIVPSPAGGASSGIVLAELYDLSGTLGVTSGPRLVNLSTRAPVAGSGVLIAGFVVAGGTSKTLLIRGVGPSLQSFGVSGAMPDPQVHLYATDGTRITGNNDWGANTTLERASNRVGAFRFAGPVSGDAAVLVTVAPGAYTAQLSAVNGIGGVALIEVYEVP